MRTVIKLHYVSALSEFLLIRNVLTVLFSFDRHTYIVSGFSRGSRGATGTHGALLMKKKTSKGETQFPFTANRGRCYAV